MKILRSFLRTILGGGLLFLLFSSSGSQVIAGNDYWTTNGPYGGEIWSIAVNPDNDQDILAGISGSGAQIFRSLNGGDSWFSSSNGLGTIPYSVYDIAYDPIDSNRVYIATWAGVYISLDGGNSWQLTTFTSPSFSIDVHPADGNTVYVGADINGGVWRSTDGGGSWMNILSLEGGRCLIVVAPSAPHILYAGFSRGGMYLSEDSGLTWNEVNNGFVLPPGVSALAVDPFSSSIVYMGTYSGLFKTDNSGDAWMPISAGLGSTDIRALAIDVGNQQIIYVGTGSDGGTPGVYRSSDSSGTSWVHMDAGMGSVFIMSLATDKAQPRSLYAGSTSSGIWKYTSIASSPPDFGISIDNGALFTNQITVTLAMTAPPGTEHMIISNDGGFGQATWEPYTTYKPWLITDYGSYVIPRIVYAKYLTDGEVSGLYQDDIILDQNPPTGTIIITGTPTSTAATFNDSPAYTYDAFSNSNPYTVSLPVIYKYYIAGFRLVELSLSAMDDVSGVDSMLISNDMYFIGARWQAYTQKMTWYVNEMGATTVYIKYRDRAGNESQVYSAATPSP